MYILRVKDSFDAAHRLRGHKGQCKNVHGHRYEVEVCIKGAELDDMGMVADFALIKSDLKKYTEPLDHALLLPEHDYENGFNKFDTVAIPFDPNPTAEVMAREISIWMSEDCGWNVKSVTLWETEKCGVTYEK